MITLSDVERVLNLGLKHMLIIAVTCGIFLTIPTEWVTSYGIKTDTLDFFRLGAVVVLIFSACHALVHFIAWLFARPIDERNSKRKQQSRRDSILRLVANTSEEEKRVLRFFVAKNTKTFSCPKSEPLIETLRKAGLIDFVSHARRPGWDVYACTPDLWELLNTDITVLDGESNAYIDFTKEAW